MCAGLCQDPSFWVFGHPPGFGQAPLVLGLDLVPPMAFGSWWVVAGAARLSPASRIKVEPPQGEKDAEPGTSTGVLGKGQRAAKGDTAVGRTPKTT